VIYGDYVKRQVQGNKDFTFSFQDKPEEIVKIKSAMLICCSNDIVHMQVRQI